MFGLVEYNGMERRNRVKWNGIERNRINLSFHCLDILERRGTNFAFYHLSSKLEGNRIEIKQ
jgi:hypothetical protein